MNFKAMFALCTASLLLLAGCSNKPASSQESVQSTASGTTQSTQLQTEDTVDLVATTYPVYLLASAITEHVEGVQVTRLNTGAVSCLHDYTLSVNDMKQIEGADIIVMNGAGLEEFMDDALERTTGTVVDCSVNVPLLENEGHVHVEGDENDHDHGHWDPHYWMNPENMVIAAENIYNKMVELDADNTQQYQENLLTVTTMLNSWKSNFEDIFQVEEGPEITGLITFHDGFRYFADAYDLPLLAAIEEEEGSEASAKEINEITQLVQEYQIPVIFTEVNGSDATAQAIARETGCQVAQLNMLMDGPEYSGLDDYYDVMIANVQAIVNGFAGEEVLVTE